MSDLNTPQSNSDIAAANPLEPSTSTSNEMIASPQDAPINQTAARNPDQAQQSQTASSAMATTATQPTPSQVATQQKAIADKTAIAQNPATQNPHALHGAIFKNVLGMLAGGSQRPVKNPDGSFATNPDGSVKMAQAGVKTLGASILAGAISGMVAGMATPDRRTQLGGGRSIADNSGAFAAGAQAGSQYTQQGQQNKAQSQVDEDRARAFAITDHNLKQHAAILTNLKMQGDIMDDTLDTASKVIQGMQDEQDSGEAVDEQGNPIDLIKKQNVSEEEAQAMLKDNTLHVTRDMMFPDSKQLVTDANGDQKYVYTYTIYDPKGLIRLTDKLRNDPAFKDKLEHVPNGQSVPVSVLAKYATEQNVIGSAAQGTSDQMDEYNEASSSKNKYDIKAAIKNKPVIRQILPEIGKYSHYPLDIALDKMSQDPSMKDKKVAFDAYYQSLGVTREGLQSMVNKRAADLKQGEKGQEFQPVPSDIVAGAQHDLAVRNPQLPAATVDSYRRQPGPKPTYAEYNRVMEEAGKTNDRIIAQKNALTKLGDTEQNQLFQNGKLLNSDGSVKATLNLENAPDEMLVDQHTGRPIPWKALTKMAPTMQETNRADFADTVLKTASTLQKMKAAGQLPNGPLTGVTTEMLAKAGMSTEDAGKALAAIGFMQTAATGAHVGGRFSVPVMEKMNKLVGLNMNDSQFIGSMNEITDVMQHYKDKGGRISVAEWSEMDPAERKRMMEATSLAGANAGSGNPITPQAITKPAGTTGTFTANGVEYYTDGKNNLGPVNPQK